MLNLKEFSLSIIAITFSFALFGQQAKLMESLDKRNGRPLTLVLNDADHDGITDQLDKEPNTPAGCPVDTHGVTLDTDGDGVPDCKDKEKLTQQKCFPVNEDGIGHCPEPGTGNVGARDDFSCRINSFPVIEFRTGTKDITADQQLILDSIAIMLMNFPNCSAILQGYYDTKMKLSEEVTTARLKSIIGYLREKRQISESRLLVNAIEGKKINTIDFIPGAN